MAPIKAPDRRRGVARVQNRHLAVTLPTAGAGGDDLIESTGTRSGEIEVNVADC